MPPPTWMIHERDDLCPKEISKLFNIGEKDEKASINGGVDIEIDTTV